MLVFYILEGYMDGHGLLSVISDAGSDEIYTYSNLPIIKNVTDGFI